MSLFLLLLSVISYSKGLPEKVDSSLKHHYPNLNQYKVSKYTDSELEGKLLYEVGFLDDRGLYILSYFDSEGELIFIEEEITKDDLPESIKTQVSKLKIDYITRSRDFKDGAIVPENYYVNGFEKIGNKEIIYHYYFDANGEVLEKEMHKKGKYVTVGVVIVILVLAKLAFML